MEEIHVLKSMCNSRKLYDKYSHILIAIRQLEPEIKAILGSLSGYYEAYPDREKATIDELRLYHFQQHPASKDKVMIEACFVALEGSKIENEELLKDMLDLCVERYAVNKILLDGIPFIDGKTSSVMDKVKSHIAEYEEITGKIECDEDPACNLTLEEMLELQAKNGLLWRLPWMRDNVGPFGAGSLMHVFARPETGKTSFAASEATYLASQLVGTDKVVLYLNNEEPIYRVKMRCYPALLGHPLKTLATDPKKAHDLYYSRGGTNLVFVEGVNSIRLVEKYLKRYKPVVTIIDQGPKVLMSGNHPRHEALQMVYAKLREFTRTYETGIITLGQADGASEHRKFLSLTNIDGAKTGLPGELDVALGIGMTDEAGKENVRYLSLCKNKLTGMLERGAVYFDNAIVRYK